MEKVDEKRVDVDEKRILDVMANLQREAESGISRGALNTPNSIRLQDNVNYWDKTRDLPSKGLLYPDGTVIEARPLKVIEVKKLASINLENVDYVINDIVRSCVRVRGISINDLFVADKLYLILWMRAVTYKDSSYTVPFICPCCKKESSYHFEVESIKVDELKDCYDANKNLTLENGDLIGIKYLTIGDESDIKKFIISHQKTLGAIDEDLLGLACMITNINGNNMSLMEKYKYVLEFTPRDLSQITTYVSNYKIGIQDDILVNCKLCGEDAPIGVTFRSDFFLPKYTDI